MSSISLPLKTMLAASVLAGLTMIACGEDAPANNDGDDGKPGKTADAGKGKGKDGGTTKKDAASPFPQAEPGDECEGTARAQCSECDTAPACVTTCEDGEYGECKSLASLVPDSGGKPPSVTTDGGTFTIKDGGVSVKFGDAEVDIPATECPDTFTCSDIGAAIGIPLKFCAAGFLPPTCTETKDCTEMGFKLATCGMIPVLGGMACLQSCK